MKYYIKYLLLLPSIFFTLGCNSDGDNCDDFEIIEGVVNFNGIDYQLSLAELTIHSIGYDRYVFEIIGRDELCEGWKQFQFGVSTPVGTDVTGSHNIIAFSDPSMGDAGGTFTIQMANSSVLKIIQLISGTVKIADLGENRFDIEVDATLAVGEGPLTMKINHQF